MTKGEKEIIIKIINNSQLRQEINNLGFSNILDYLEKKGVVNLLSLFNKLKEFLLNYRRDFNIIEDIFSYIDFLLCDDMIAEAFYGKTLTKKPKNLCFY